MLKTNLGKAFSPKEIFEDFYIKYEKDIKDKATKQIIDIDGNVKYIYNLNKGHLDSNTDPIWYDHIGKPIHYSAVDKFINDKLVYTVKIISDKFEQECYYYDNGNKHIEINYDSNGVLNKTSGPSIIYYNKDGSICQEEFWIEGKKQLVAESLENCNITSTNFNIDGQEICIEITTEKKEGNRLISEKSYLKNKLHSVNGSPSFKMYNDKGEESIREYHKEGKLHNLNGPAQIYKMSEEFYYIEGKNMSKDEYDKVIKEKLIKIFNNKKEDKCINDISIDKEKNKSGNKINQSIFYPGSLKVEIEENNGKFTKIITYPEKTVVLNSYKKEVFNKDNKLHSFNDEPAVIYFTKEFDVNSVFLPNFGKKEWWQEGKRHRNGDGAVEYSSGLKEFWIEGTWYSKKDYDAFKNTDKALKEIQEALKNVIGGTTLSTKNFVDNFKDYRVERKKDILKRDVIFHYLKDKIFREDYLDHNGDIIETRFFDEKGRIDSPIEGFPAIIYMREDGGFENIYYEKGVPVTDGIRSCNFNSNMKPISLFIYENNILVEEQTFDKNGEIEFCRVYDSHGNISSFSTYNETNAKIIIYNENKNTIASIVKINRDLLLDGEGALQVFDEHGMLVSYSSYKNGFYHCYNGKPSIVEYKEDKIIEKYIELNYNLIDKPSIIERSNKGNLSILKEHFTDIKGKIIKTNDYTKKVKFKSEFTSAGYRVAANQVSKAVKRSILLLMQNKGMEDSKLKHLEDVLESEIGNALISVSIGYILSMDKFKDNDRTNKIAKEFRVEGMTTAGDVIVDSVVNYILPNIIKETEEQKKFRIEENKELNKSNIFIDNSEKKENIVNETI